MQDHINHIWNLAVIMASSLLGMELVHGLTVVNEVVRLVGEIIVAIGGCLSIYHTYKKAKK